MALKKEKVYYVTFSTAGNVYDEQQHLRSIYESLYALSKDERDMHTPESEKSRKE